MGEIGPAPLPEGSAHAAGALTGVPAARVVIADSTNRYDGRDVATRPLGGTETSVIQLAEALARRGHDVTCYTNIARRLGHRGVTWAPLAARGPGTCTLFLAVQHPELLGFVPRPARRALWVVWPPSGLRRPVRTLRIWWYRPSLVLVSEFQRRVFPPWLPGLHRAPIIPLGLPAVVRGLGRLAVAPAPCAIFAANPQRDLRWLIELWGRAILPRVPDAELHIYGIRDYDYRYGEPWEETWTRLGQFVSDDLPAAARASLRPHPPAPKEALWAAMRASRLILHPGHPAEAFCLVVAEAQALGVPAVVRPIAVMPERVRDGTTGFVARDAEAFARRAVDLLTDDVLWRRQHEAALALQQGWTWDETAAAFETSVLPPGGLAPGGVRDSPGQVPPGTIG